MAKTGWTLEYINSLPSEHLLYSYHWIKKVERDQWDILSSHLGTVWNIEDLRKLKNNEANPASSSSSVIFVPLSLVMNPGLVEGLLNRGNNSKPGQPSLPLGDSLATDMALPKDVVPMSTLSKEDFLKLVRGADYSILSR